VIPPLFTGPRLPDRDIGEPFFPGRNNAVWQYIHSLKRPAMLSIGEVAVDPATIDDEYPKPQTWPGSGMALSVGTEFGTEYRVDWETRTVLLRMTRQVSPHGGIGMRTEGWRLVNVAPERRGEARDIAEHLAREDWAQTCHEQFRYRTQPGMLQVAHTRYRAGLHALGCVANAAVVTTDRLKRRRTATRPT
jgi:hypothetical protein